MTPKESGSEMTNFFQSDKLNMVYLQ